MTSWYAVERVVEPYGFKILAGDPEGVGEWEVEIADTYEGPEGNYARIIIAAPDMLAALRDAKDLLTDADLDQMAADIHPDRINATCDAITAAIAKAEAPIREAKGSTPRKTGECIYGCRDAIYLPGPKVWVCERPGHWAVTPWSLR